MSPDASSLTAAVLAGGKGLRLRSLVSDRPKVLADVNGRPFLAYLLDRLAAQGIRHVVLCTGYMAETVASAFGNTYGTMRITYSVEQAPLDTGGALRLALPHLSSDPTLVLNGDSYCEFDLMNLRQTHARHAALASIVAVDVTDVSRFGRLVIDDENRIVRFEEKGSATGSGWINAGVYLLSHHLLHSLPAGPSSLERDAFPRCAGKGLYASRQPHAAFIDIGTEQTYRSAADFFARRGV